MRRITQIRKTKTWRKAKGHHESQSIDFKRQLRIESLEERRLLASVPFGATPDDTGEFFLGRIAVTPVLLESDGTIDTSTEDWTSNQIANVVANIEEGLQWWVDLLDTQNTVHDIDWVLDSQFVVSPFETAYEPISRISNDYQLWVEEFLTAQDLDSTAGIESNIRAFNHAQRIKHEANWSFTIFVTNSENDSDGKFRNGGSFSRAFAFAGGQFFIVPSTRPASTFAHETGHMFWARDEYPGGGNYYQNRGYYNAQNENATDLNPDPNFVQQPSIMAAGTLLEMAYQDVESPASTLAQIGWVDSDGDGIFDVLDVPLQLDGVGSRSSDTSYRFVGTASVQTLANVNSSGQQNDVSINRVTDIRYRIDGGPWQSAASPDAYELDVDITIPLAPGQTGTIEIEARDIGSGVTSNIFTGDLDAVANSTLMDGINGFVWEDVDQDGVRQASEIGLSTWEVQLVDGTGTQLELQTFAEPDAAAPGEISANYFPGVSLTSIGLDSNGILGIGGSSDATTDSQVFVPYSFIRGELVASWFGQDHELRIEFDAPTSFVSIDAIAASDESFARIDAYDIDGNLIERMTSSGISNGQSEALVIRRESADIAYAIARPHRNTAVLFDNLKFGPESSATTDSLGRYSFTGLPADDYSVKVIPLTSSFSITAPNPTGVIDVSLNSGEELANIDFGVYADDSPWHNATADVDVSGDGFVRAIDALLVINLINKEGAQDLSGSDISFPPYVDVTNDRRLTPRDALLVIAYINKFGAGPVGSGGTNGGDAGGGDAGSGGEGEFAGWIDTQPETHGQVGDQITTRSASGRISDQDLADQNRRDRIAFVGPVRGNGQQSLSGNGHIPALREWLAERSSTGSEGLSADLAPDLLDLLAKNR
jgi:hypothetical protein